ncbi:MAG: PepSY domain-containing protein [Vicinamibacterales bacterium]
MARPTALLKRLLIFVHRWIGVALSVIFLLWFASGIVMMYWTFPAVTADDRLERLPILEPERITVSAEQAAAALGREEAPGQVRLTSFDGRPAYRFGGGRGGGGRGGGWMMVYADDGSLADNVDEGIVDRAAAAWAGRPLAQAKKESVEEVDQWTVAGGFRNLRPLYKYSFPDGQQVYVNGNTAEVVQYTTTSSRFWAYLGAIPHWMYFTPLRKHQPQWFKFVVWSSLIGTITALIGVVVAIWMLSPKKRYRHAGAPTSIPYRGWKRWHTIAGLIFGVVTVTWAFSGLLSMGPFPIIDRLTALTVPTPPAPAGEAGANRGRGGAGRGPNLAAALRGRGSPPLSVYEEKDPRTAIASVRECGVKELEFTSFAGTPVYLATNGGGETRIIPVRGPPKSSYGVDEVMGIVRDSAGKDLADLRLIDQYDAYYLDRRREAPLPVIYAELNDPLRTRYYIDPKTARVVGTYSKRNWVSRWLYHGLHSLDFPWLYNYRPLWDIVVITLMLGGTALCVTSLVLTWRVLKRKVAAVVRTRLNTPNEDLAIEA